MTCQDTPDRRAALTSEVSESCAAAESAFAAWIAELAPAALTEASALAAARTAASTSSASGESARVGFGDGESGMAPR